MIAWQIDLLILYYIFSYIRCINLINYTNIYFIRLKKTHIVNSSHLLNISSCIVPSPSPERSIMIHLKERSKLSQYSPQSLWRQWWHNYKSTTTTKCSIFCPTLPPHPPTTATCCCFAPSTLLSCEFSNHVVADGTCVLELGPMSTLLHTTCRSPHTNNCYYFICLKPNTLGPSTAAPTAQIPTVRSTDNLIFRSVPPISPLMPNNQLFLLLEIDPSNSYSAIQISHPLRARCTVMLSAVLQVAHASMCATTS